MNAPNILFFKDLDRYDTPTVGGKAANLGEMYKLKIPVPNGFAVTTNAYFEFLKSTTLVTQIDNILKSTHIDNPDELLSASKSIRSLIKKQPLPESISLDIMKSYKKLCSYGGLKNEPVAVRSSATAEDGLTDSFAGQQETYLNVVGESNLVKRVIDCWSSLYTPRSLYYRFQKKIPLSAMGVAVVVQKMVQSTVSGIMFTVNPVSRAKNEIVVETIWGLGEFIVGGQVTPDHSVIDKDSWSVVRHQTQAQIKQLTRVNSENRTVPVPKSRRNQKKLTNAQIIEIAKIGQKLHNHYQTPQDIEFAQVNSKFYILQTRPITTLNLTTNTSSTDNQTFPPADLTGQPASPGFASGEAIIIHSPSEINKVKKGHILVTTMTSPDFVPAMRRAGAIVTNEGGQTSHAAIVSRELGIPCVVGTQIATKKIKTGDMVTVDGATGQVWFKVISPIQKPTTSSTSTPTKVIKTATKIYVNLGEPDLINTVSHQNVDGVGLLRAEFIMADIGIHPKKFIADHKEKLFIDTLAKNIAKFCKAFSPRPVIYRATDFKTNEYRYLKWGKLYEPLEPNPMLGLRGAKRYICSPDVFAMEVEAIKQVRNKYGYKNLWLMIPFVRTPIQLLEVKKSLASLGLIRTPTFKLWLMVEIPTNVIMLKDFLKVGIDGISIGSNDLTMLTLGIDRDNADVAADFNELDPSVLWLIKKAIKTARRHGVTASICGQAPSNHPDLNEKLVKWGITSISVSPDAITRTRELVSWAEAKRLK